MTRSAGCPDCSKPMREVSARARTGYLLALDQCDECGGIWFDRWELFPLHHEEVARLDPVDGDRLRQPVQEAGKLGDCPRCEVPLREFHDANLPADAEVGRCFVCEGMWLQRGQLRIVKKAAALGAGNPKVEDKALQALIAAYQGKVDWSRVKDLDAATYETEEAPPGLQDVGDTLQSTLPWLALNVLFRMLLRR